jgi:ribosomal protein S18 acetylase RimI-like enzyme
VLERVPPGPGRRRHLPLLLLADPIAEGYLDEGELWVHDQGVGVVLTVPAGEAAVELRAVAVDPGRQRRGHGLAMLRALLAQLRAEGWARVVVGTGSADPAGLLLYQRAGFRPTHVERDAFSSERGYDPATLVEPSGLVHRDVIWLALDLAGLADDVGEPGAARGAEG